MEWESLNSLAERTAELAGVAKHSVYTWIKCRENSLIQQDLLRVTMGIRRRHIMVLPIVGDLYIKERAKRCIKLEANEVIIELE